MVARKSGRRGAVWKLGGRRGEESEDAKGGEGGKERERDRGLV